jgi:hypothetical protein
MITKKITTILFVSFAMAAIGCIKDFETGTNSPILKFKEREARVQIFPAAKLRLELKSNVRWELTFKQPAPDWLPIQKTTGRGNEIVELTTTRDYIGRGRESAILVAKSLNNVQKLSAEVLIFRQDSVVAKK